MAATATTGSSIGGKVGNGVSINTIPEYTIPTLRRVTYVLPNVERPPRCFALPSFQQSNEGPAYIRSGPLLLQHPEEKASLDSIYRSTSTGDRSESHPKHALPISSLVIDVSTIVQTKTGKDGVDISTPRGILYAGGRDGMISAWDLDLPMKKRRIQNHTGVAGSNDFDDESTAGLLDDYKERLDDPSSPRYEYNGYSNSTWAVDLGGSHEEGRSKVGKAKFRQCIGSHTDWVNEILLCNDNQTVVSASSDGNVNIWNPHDEQSSKTPQILGTHKDYVRALAHARNANWVASGSFDKTINLWDLAEIRHSPIITFPESSVQSSIYSLSTNQAGTILAGGSPERFVKVWDPRSGQQISHLVGHSDTVRKVVMSQDGTHLLTASSDSTVKLWSLGEQRCLHTFTHHTESVWSLHSDHPRLDVFYSGDRSGLVCKVDWDRCNEVSEGECVVLAKDTEVDEHSKFVSERNASGIHSIASIDNSFIWTASANGTICRWLDVPSRSLRESRYPLINSKPKSKKQAQDVSSSSNPRISALRSVSGNPGSAVSPSVSFSDSFGETAISIQSSGIETSDASLELESISQPKLKQSEMMYGIPFDSLVCLAPSNDPYGAAIGLGSISIRATSRAATPGDTDMLLNSASLVSIPSVLRQQSSLQQATGSSYDEAFDKAFGGPQSHISQQQQPSSLINQAQPSANFTASPPAAFPFSSHLRNADARPSSVRSGSLRFAPTATHHAYDDYVGHLDGDEEETEETDVEEDDNDAALEARLAYEERELAIDATPLRETPEDVIHCSHGLIRSTLLNDRRHCLTIDAAGLTFLWDIILGQCLGAFTWSDVIAAARESGMNERLLPGEALDVVKDRIQGHGSTPNWCTVDTKIGSLSIHLEHPRCFDAEIYLDECEEEIRSCDPIFDFKDDQRINIGRLILKNLFTGFMQREVQFRADKNGLLKNGALGLERAKDIERVLGLKAGQLTNRTVKEEGSGKGYTAAAGMRIALAIAPKTPAILSVQSPLSPTNTHQMSDLQRLMTIQHASQNTNSQGSGGTGDYFSIQRAADPSGSAANTPQGLRNAESPLTPGAATNAVSPGGGVGGGLMGKLRLGLRRDQTVSKKGPKTPSNTSNQNAQALSKDGMTNQSSGTNHDQDGLTPETRQQLQTLRTILATIGGSVPPRGHQKTDSVEKSIQSSTEITERRRFMEEIPIITFPSQAAIIISESAHDSGSFQVKYRGLLDQTQNDIISLELQSPTWLLECLFDFKDSSGLSSIDVLREKDKLTFLLVPWEKSPNASLSNSQTNATEKNSSKTSLTKTATLDEMESLGKRKLPAMPTGNSRLTATRMLRAKKACAYVADKLHLIEISDEDEEGKDGRVGEGNGNASGFASIIASRRPSAIISDPNTLPNVNMPTSPLTPSAITSHATTSIPSTNPFTRAFSMAKVGLSVGSHPNNVPQASQQPPAQVLQLRRPSAVSIVSSGGGTSLNSTDWVMPHGSAAHDYLDLICKDEIVPASMTLAQIHRFIWKSGAPIKLEYRWKPGVVQTDENVTKLNEVR